MIKFFPFYDTQLFKKKVTGADYQKSNHGTKYKPNIVNNARNCNHSQKSAISSRRYRSDTKTHHGINAVNIQINTWPCYELPEGVTIIAG